MFTSNGKGLTLKAFKNDLGTRSISACLGVPYQFLARDAL
jgi:hypothetical protein